MDRLLAAGNVLEPGRYDTLIIACGEHERHPALYQQVGDRVRQIAAKIHIHDSPVDVRFGVDKAECILERADGTEDDNPGLAEFDLNFIGEHELILNYEDTPAPQTSVNLDHLPPPACR
jgi:hypothetical protein